MQVLINGETTTLENVASVDDLLRHLDIQGKIAVEINGEIVPRSRFGTHPLADGDRVEIVRAIGGGGNVIYAGNTE
jgi:sulfur carrier protein